MKVYFIGSVLCTLKIEKIDCRTEIDEADCNEDGIAEGSLDSFSGLC